MELDFAKLNGLVPAVVQDAASGEVLMVGFMNEEAYRDTMSRGEVTFFSRTRNQLWTKGETSGNRLKLLAATIDCDRDTLLLQVEVEEAALADEIMSVLMGDDVDLRKQFIVTNARDVRNLDF